jgi:hypothetical protein
MKRILGFFAMTALSIGLTGAAMAATPAESKTTNI